MCCGAEVAVSTGCAVSGDGEGCCLDCPRCVVCEASASAEVSTCVSSADGISLVYSLSASVLVPAGSAEVSFFPQALKRNSTASKRARSLVFIFFSYNKCRCACYKCKTYEYRHCGITARSRDIDLFARCPCNGSLNCCLCRRCGFGSCCFGVG